MSVKNILFRFSLGEPRFQALLSVGQTTEIENRLARLNQLPPASVTKSAQLRALLPDLFSRCLFLSGESDGIVLPADLPAWLAAALDGLGNPANLTCFPQNAAEFILSCRYRNSGCPSFTFFKPKSELHFCNPG